MNRRQFVNDPRAHVAEGLAGFELAHRDLVRWNREPSFVARAEPPPRPKVGVISGGGSGHEPLHTGFVGEGMLDAAVPGAIFSSPSAAQVTAATAAAECGEGVLHVIKNYTGDITNFGLAAELARSNGIAVESVVVADDLATDRNGDDGAPGRRGTAAVVAVEKICGAGAERGWTLDRVAELGRRVAAGSRTMAVALSACAHPGESRPSFELGSDEVELGVGIHGERGTGRVPFDSAAALTRALVEPLVEALGLGGRERVIVIVNGLGAAHPLELSVVFGEVVEALGERGIEVARSLVGPYVTSLDMHGCSVTLTHADAEILDLWDAPVRTPALRW